jgi:YfiR/HmsC-like
MAAMHRLLQLWPAVVGVWLLSLVAAHAVTEADLKAAYLFNFAKYVKWPQAKWADADTPLIFGILGDDPLVPILLGLQGTTAQGRSVIVRRYATALQAKAAHMLFIGASERGRQSEVALELQGSSVLIVGEGDGFLRRGGMIELRLKSSKVKFGINQEAAMREQIQISSQLMKLAESS